MHRVQVLLLQNADVSIVDGIMVGVQDLDSDATANSCLDDSTPDWLYDWFEDNDIEAHEECESTFTFSDEDFEKLVRAADQINLFDELSGNDYIKEQVSIQDALDWFKNKAVASVMDEANEVMSMRDLVHSHMNNLLGIEDDNPEAVELESKKMLLQQQINDAKTQFEYLTQGDLSEIQGADALRVVGLATALIGLYDEFIKLNKNQ